MSDNLNQLAIFKKPIKLFNGKDSNFSFYDFFYNPAIITNNINNVPTNSEILKNIKYLVNDILQPIYNRFGPIKIISGYKSIELSKFLNLSPSSHSFGQGVDFVLKNPNIDNMILLNHVVQCLKFKTIIAEHFPNGWIHITYDLKNFDKVIKLKTETHDYKILTLSEINKLFNYVSTGIL